MKREIKFRGKDAITGDWLYGNLIQRTGYFPSIMYDYEHLGEVRYAYCAVTADTIGQYTGLKDKHGVEIYEGDILFDKDGCTYGIVAWNTLGFELGSRHMDCYDNIVCEVVGNIHDHPELADKILNPEETEKSIKEETK